VASLCNIELDVDICGSDWDLCYKFKKDPESEQIQDFVVLCRDFKDVVLFGDVHNEEEHI